ncbi:M15 family metallopeptidase [Candidatus Cardinium hertigii]|jgi:D-alanyl-D-alanine dipeptidase|uniref:D-alanyl-D-alanine dipeptidase n=1 Tax=Candidatus Cardinium hertigii TaxID=247481 RepID=A0A3N2QCK5_9BACT|nr:M15 family metallopeptidase [Candidatus Cardinium hertigii]ROT47501.1 peptidase M15 [Candidatus Cardinium hertigii]
MKTNNIFKNLTIGIGFVVGIGLIQKSESLLSKKPTKEESRLEQLEDKRPEDFVYLDEIDKKIKGIPRYYRSGNWNFIGQKFTGYTGRRFSCTKSAAEALKKANDDFDSQGYRMVLYDVYRPQKATNFILAWSQSKVYSDKNKGLYYPRENKEDLFKKGYISKKSGHSRGSTFDLTIISKKKHYSTQLVKEIRTLADGTSIMYLNDGTVDMGTHFDFLDVSSNHNSNLVTEEQTQNRNFLKKIMEKHGFVAYEKEWWHYTYAPEDYPNTYFNFDTCEPSKVEKHN